MFWLNRLNSLDEKFDHLKVNDDDS